MTTLESKRPKDIHKPKTPQSSYFLFNNQVRASFRLKYPDKTPRERAKLVAAQWNQMTKDEKKPFNDQALMLKKKYLTKMEIYKKSQQYQDYQKKLKDWKERPNNINNEDVNDKDEITQRKKNWKEFKVWDSLRS